MTSSIRLRSNMLSMCEGNGRELPIGCKHKTERECVWQTHAILWRAATRIPTSSSWYVFERYLFPNCFTILQNCIMILWLQGYQMRYDKPRSVFVESASHFFNTWSSPWQHSSLISVMVPVNHALADFKIDYDAVVSVISMELLKQLGSDHVVSKSEHYMRLLCSVIPSDAFITHFLFTCSASLYIVHIAILCIAHIIFL